MNAEPSNTVGNAALVVSGTGGLGLVATINEYAVVIGLTLTVISIIIGLVFHVRADRWRRQESLENRAALTREVLAEIERERKEP